MAGPGYSPFIRIAGSPVVYSAPIVATGDGPFDVVHHTNTGDRVLGVHIAPPSPPGQFLESWVDLLFVKGFDAGQPIIYISTDPGCCAAMPSLSRPPQARTVSIGATRRSPN